MKCVLLYWSNLPLFYIIKPRFPLNTNVCASLSNIKVFLFLSCVNNCEQYWKTKELFYGTVKQTQQLLIGLVTLNRKALVLMNFFLDY